MIIVFSAEPTQVVKVSHKVTHALFEWIEKYEKKKGMIVFPDCLTGLNHVGLEITLKR